jgi:hypothetical protein
MLHLQQQRLLRQRRQQLVHPMGETGDHLNMDSLMLDEKLKEMLCPWLGNLQLFASCLLLNPNNVEKLIQIHFIRAA